MQISKILFVKVNSKMEKHVYGTAVTLTAATEYTVPSDGYFSCEIRLTGTGSNKFAFMAINNVGVIRVPVQPSEYIKQCIFVKKGMTIKYSLGSGITNGVIGTFIPFA